MNYHWNWKIFWELAPDASGSYMGTLVNGLAWTLAVRHTVKNASGVYYQGDLISPRGGVVTKGVFVVKEEWTCE